MTKRSLSESDRDLWRAIQREVRPLPGRQTPPLERRSVPTPAAPAEAPMRQPRRQPPVASHGGTPELEHGTAAGLDRRLAERLSRGRLPIEERIDLHGMTQAEAHEALNQFLAESARRGRRCLLVITGKGRSASPGDDAPYMATASGVLSRAVPRWLNQSPNRQLLLAFDYARPPDGGTGALYVLLKRNRSK